MKTYYEILEIEKTATRDEIKKAYRRKARQYHPDKNEEGADDTEMQRINVAYEVLYDEERRKNYDETGADKIEPFLEAAKNIITQKTMSWIQTQDEKTDLKQFLVNDLENDLVNIMGNKTRGEAIIAKLQNVKSRLKYSGNDKDILTEAVQKQIEHVTNQLSTVADDVARNRLALRLVRDYEYQSDAVPMMRVFLGNPGFVHAR